MHLKLLIISFFLFTSCHINDKTQKFKEKASIDIIRQSNKETPYEPKQDDYYKNQVWTTLLKGGYKLCYTISDSFKSVYLKKDTNLVRLNSDQIEVGTFYSLGILIKDYPEYFVFGHDNGNGVPYSIELIDKKTGSNIIGYKVISIEGKFPDKYLVYYNDQRKDLKEKFIVYSIPNQIEEYFKLPPEIFTQENRFNFLNMTVDTILKNKMKVSFNLDAGTLTRFYNR